MKFRIEYFRKISHVIKRLVYFLPNKHRENWLHDKAVRIYSNVTNKNCVRIYTHTGLAINKKSF